MKSGFARSMKSSLNFVSRVRLEQKWNAPIIFIATYPIALSKIHLEGFIASKIQFIEKPYDFKTISATIQKILYVDFDRLFDVLETARKELLENPPYPPLLKGGKGGFLPQFAMKALKSELDNLWEKTYEVEGKYFKRLVMKLKTAVSNLITEDNFTLKQLDLFEQGIALLKKGEITEEEFYSFSNLLAEASIDTMVRPKTEPGVDRLLEMYESAMADGEV